ncbi:MAG: hypothetical protein Q9208_006136 [Pyrenodesmia sp. 3 TL-2023]
MASSTIFFKTEEPSNAWSHQPVLKFGAVRDGAPYQSCGIFSEFLRHGVDGIDRGKHSKAGSGRGPIPPILNHQVNSKTASVPRSALKNVSDPSRSSTTAEDGNLSTRHEKPTRRLTKTETKSSDERGRSPPVAQKGSALSYQYLQQIFEVDIDGKTTTCIAQTSKRKVCKNRISKASVSEARKVLDSIASADDARTLKNQSDHLLGLAELLVCKRNHQEKATLFAQAWEAAIAPTSKRHEGSVHVTTASKIVAPSSIKKSTTRSDKFDTSKTCIRTFVPYDARAKSQIDTSDFVRGAIERNLTPRETSTGYIYIYWFPGNFGHLKLRCTTRTVDIRLREFERQCGHKTHLAFPVAEEDQQLIPHVHRVENILNAQLRNCRRKEIRCHGCGKCHQEWLEEAEQEAIDAVRRWSDWMRKDPYEEVSPGVWRLKKSQKENLETLCKTPPRPTVNRTRSVSTSCRKEKNEKSSTRLSILPLSLRDPKSAEPLRRSARIAEKQRTSTADWDLLEFKLELKA